MEIAEVNVTRAFGRFIWLDKGSMPPMDEDETMTPAMEVSIAEPDPPFRFLDFACPFPQYQRQGFDMTYKGKGPAAPEDLANPFVERQ